MKELIVDPSSLLSQMIDPLRFPSVRDTGSDGLYRLQCDVLEAVASGLPLEQVVLLLCHHVERLAPGIACSVLMADDASVEPDAEPYAGGQLDRPVATDDVDSDPRWMSSRAMPTGAGSKGVWSIPVKGRDGRVVGSFTLHYHTLRQPTPFERSIAETSVHLCALAMEHDTIWSRLRLAHQRLDAALDNMSQGLCFFGNGRLIICNRRYSEIYRLPPGLIRPGMSFQEILDARTACGSDPAIAPGNNITVHSEMLQDAPTEITVDLKDGRTIAVHLQPMPNAEWVATHEDITGRRRTEARIAYLAQHDALTGLPNRALFHERLQQALAAPDRGSACAVFCLDLDLFKTVNDTLGHPAGDRLLHGVAQRLRNCVRDVDTVSRLGGDEFAILLVGLDQPNCAGELALRIVQVMNEPFDLDGHAVVMRVSIGIAVSPHDGASPGKLLKSADTALYRAKADKRGSYRFFEPEMDARLQARLALEQDLREALQNNEFELVYQPIVTLATDMICGFEALLRWRHASRGLVMPGAFIQLAEETGLIEVLGAWVLQQACAEAASWPDPIRVAVNLSAMQFRNRNFAKMVSQALSASGLPPSRLELEITESIFLSKTAETLAILHELRGLGVSIAMDDFGTGYSSLSYLRSFPFDRIKIDQSFIQDISESEVSIAIVRAVMGLARSMRMVTTAEGVETREQLAQLRHEGCTEVQGYLFSGPISADAARSMIGEQAQPCAAAVGSGCRS